MREVAKRMASLDPSLAAEDVDWLIARMKDLLADKSLADQISTHGQAHTLMSSPYCREF